MPSWCQNSMLARACVSVCLTGGVAFAQAAAPGSFNRTLARDGVTFVVSCANDTSLPVLRIAVSGMTRGTAAITRQAEGAVIGAEVADLNGDRSPEVYVYVQSAGSGSYGTVVAYSADARTSLSEVFLPSIAVNSRAAKGYRGHDRFRIDGRTLVRSFPIYRDGDTNVNPRGGTRQIVYELAGGKGGWRLTLVRVADQRAGLP
jgi:hypothetical protein